MEVRSLQIRVDFGLFYGTSFLPGARIFWLFALFPCNSTITISFYPLIFPGLTTFSGNPNYSFLSDCQHHSLNIGDDICARLRFNDLSYNVSALVLKTSLRRFFSRKISILRYISTVLSSIPFSLSSRV